MSYRLFLLAAIPPAISLALGALAPEEPPSESAYSVPPFSCASDPESCYAAGECIEQFELAPHSVQLWYELPKPLRESVAALLAEAQAAGDRSLTEIDIASVKGIGAKRVKVVSRYLCLGDSYRAR